MGKYDKEKQIKECTYLLLTRFISDDCCKCIILHGRYLSMLSVIDNN